MFSSPVEHLRGGMHLDFMPEVEGFGRAGILRDGMATPCDNSSGELTFDLRLK